MMAKSLLIVSLVLLIGKAHSNTDVQDATDKLIVSNEEAGQVAQNFGSMMGKILHSLPRINPYPSAVVSLGYKAQSPPPKEILYPVKLDNSYSTGYTIKEVEESAANYVIGVAVISLVPAILALFSLLGAFYCCCKAMCCRIKGKGTVKVPSKAARIGAAIAFAALFLTGLIASAGANYSINNFVSSAVNVGDLAKAMAADAMSLGNTTLNNVQTVFDTVVDINHTVIDTLPSGSKCTNYIDCIKSIFGIVSIAQNSLKGNATAVQNTAKKFFGDGKVALVNLSDILREYPNLLTFATKLDLMNVTIANVTAVIPLLRSNILNLNDTLYSARAINYSRLNETLSSFETKKFEFYQNNLTSELYSLDSAMKSDGFKESHLDALIVSLSNPPDSNSNAILAKVDILNQSLNMLPNLNSLSLKVKSLTENIEFMRNQILPSLSSSLINLRLIERSINQTTILENMRFTNKTFEESLRPGLSDIRLFNKNINGSNVKLQQHLPKMTSFISSINSTVKLIVNIYNPALKNGLLKLNASIAGAKCIFDIIDGIKAINLSIVNFPGTVNKLISDYENLAKEYASNITNLATAFINPAIDAIDSIGNSLKNFTEISSLENEITSANNTLNTLPDSGTTDSSLRDAISLNISSILKDGISQFENVRQAVTSIPLDSFNSTLNSINPQLQTLFLNLSGQDLVLGNLSNTVDTLKSNLTILTFLLKNNWPPPTNDVLDGPRQILQALKADLLNVPDRSKIIDGYKSAQDSFGSSVDINSMKGQISSCSSSVSNDFKDSLVADVLNSLNSFDSTKNGLPDLHSLANDMRSFNVTVENSRSSLSLNLNQLNTYESSFLNGGINSSISQIDQFTALDPSFEGTATGMFQTLCDAQNSVFGTVSSALSQGQTFINQAKSNVRTYSTYPDKYDSYKQSYSSQASEYSSPSSAGAVVLGIIPMLLFILVLVAIIFKLLRLAKVSALIMCFLIPLYFFLSIPFIFATTLIGDHCPILSDAVQSQVSLVLNQTLAKSGGDIASKSNEIFDAFKYFTTCSGDPIDPINFAVQIAGKDPNNIASFSIPDGSSVNLSTNVDSVLSQFNASTLFAKVSSSAVVNGESISVASPLKNQITSIQTTLVSTLKSILSGIRSLISCSRISALYNGLLKIPCGFALGAFGSLAFIFTFIPFLMITFVLLTIRLLNILKLQDQAIDNGGKVSGSSSEESHHSIDMGPRNKKISIHPLSPDIEMSEERKNPSSRNSAIRYRRNTPPSYSDEGEGGANHRHASGKNSQVRNSLRMTTMSPPPADSEDSESRRR